MKIDEQVIGEYLFKLLSTQQRKEVERAIKYDEEIRKEYQRLKAKFENLKILEPQFPNPILRLSQGLIKVSAYAALLTFAFSFWFVPFNNAQPQDDNSMVMTLNKAHNCTSGISPQSNRPLYVAFNDIFAKNIQGSSSIDTDVNYSTPYLKKLSL